MGMNTSIFKYPSFFLVCLFLSFSLAKQTQVKMDLVTLAKEVGTLEGKKYRLFLLWSNGIKYLSEFKENEAPPLPTEWRDPKIYFTSRDKQKEKAEKTYPLLKNLVKMCKSEFISIDTDLAKKKKILLELANQDQLAARQAVLDHFAGKVDFPYAGLDYLLGISYDEVESDLAKKNKEADDRIFGLPKFWSQTDFKILKDVFSALPLKKGEHFFDLGSGHGRVLMYGALTHPEVQFRGVEIVCERANEVNKNITRLNLTNVQNVCKNALEFDLHDADVIFMFNPFPSIMPQMLEKIRQAIQKRKIRIVVIGETYAELLKTPWLKLDQDINTITSVGIFSAKNDTAKD
jgi:precorrin-6B methylase 2